MSGPILPVTPESLRRLAAADVVIAGALDGLREIVAKLETRVKELEAQRDAR